MTIEDNNVVSFNYEVKDAKTGEVVDSNVGQAPLSFITGKQQIIPGLENQMKGMSAGENADILVPAAEAYGEYNPEAVQTMPREQFAGIDLQEGMTLYGQSEDGQTVQVTVKSFDENEVVIDFNHPLAGKDLLFSVTVSEVREPTVNESLSGQVEQPGQESGGCGTGCGCH
ncbi:FKBP-type peptidyl-prolyl cis-trans isomerase [Hydrogenimonas cancrithermarum]|nr:peptidylprolyl isomerase [Hydrogenimonas cancrithermarum]